MRGEREEMWGLYGELGYLSLNCARLSSAMVGDGWLVSFSEESELAGLLYPELIFCSDDERDGGLGRSRRLARLLGRLKALVSDDRKVMLDDGGVVAPLVGVELETGAAMPSAMPRWRLPTARR